MAFGRKGMLMVQKKEMKMKKFGLILIGVAITLSFFTLGAFAGDLEPSVPPGPTMKTLNEIPPTWSQLLTTSERFELVMGGEAVLDKETGLVWQRTPWVVAYTWDEACNKTPYNSLIGGRLGWRLPTVVELTTLLDKGQTSPALPIDHPFNFNVYNYELWTATPYTYFGSTNKAWFVTFNNNGGALVADMNDTKFFMLVRGGNGRSNY